MNISKLWKVTFMVSALTLTSIACIVGFGNQGIENSIDTSNNEPINHEILEDLEFGSNFDELGDAEEPSPTPTPSQTPLPPPDNIIHLVDDVGDTTYCYPISDVDTPQADINWVEVVMNSDEYKLSVQMMTALTGDFNLSLYFQLNSLNLATQEPNGGGRKILVNVDETTTEGGFLDAYTGEIDDSNVIVHTDHETGIVTVTLPESVIAPGDTTMQVESFYGTGNQICDVSPEITITKLD